MNHSNHQSAPITLCIEFLTRLFKEGKSYSTINTARSAISFFVKLEGESWHTDFGKHPLTVQFMKGVFKQRPALPKYKETWDAKLVLDKLKSWDNEKISLKELSLKCTTLLALASGQRVQTLAAIDLTHIRNLPDYIVCEMKVLLKTSRPGSHSNLKICRFSADESLCPVSCLNTYIKRTSDLRTDNKLFISFHKPYKPVTRQTISRWICTTLHMAGVPKHFTAHSTRSAGTSKAFNRINIDTILETAGWASSRTFARFYKRPINIPASFTDAVFS